MAKTRLLIVGAGGHGRSVAEAAELTGKFEIVGFLDDSLPEGESVLGVTVLGSLATVSNHRAAFDQTFVAIGHNASRERLMQQLQDAGLEISTIVHPQAFVSPRATVATGCAVMANAVVGTEARLGVGAIVNSGAVVDHHAQVEDYGHLGVNASMAGGSVLGRGAWMQASTALGYGVKIRAGAKLVPGEAVERETNKYREEK